MPISQPHDRATEALAVRVRDSAALVADTGIGFAVVTGYLIACKNSATCGLGLGHSAGFVDSKDSLTLGEVSGRKHS